MTARRPPSFLLLPLALLLLACPGPMASGDAGAPDAGEPDAGRPDAGEPDAGEPDAGVVAQETEPNNGNPETDAVAAPGAMAGAIGQADDVDIFMVDLVAGQQWRWTADAEGSAFAPHLAIVEQANSVPIQMSRGPAGGSAHLEQLVLKTGSYAVIVRDSRNVPSSSSQNAGSADHTYLLTATTSTRTAQALTVPGSATGTLSSPWDSALYGFTLTSTSPLTVRVRAKTQVPPSELDTRVTLFNASTNVWHGTNDDESLSTTDSLLTGTVPPGSYRVVVDNLSETASALGFQVEVTSP